MTLGERIKQVRKDNRLNQTEFAQQLGIGRTYVSKIEKNVENPSETLLMLISIKYKVNLEWLKCGQETAAEQLLKDPQTSVIQKIIDQVIRKFGADYQLNIAIEEMSELTKEITKMKRSKGNIKAVTEEIADVYIMLMQVKQIYGIDDAQIEKIMTKKLERLEKNLKEGTAK